MREDRRVPRKALIADFARRRRSRTGDLKREWLEKLEQMIDEYFEKRKGFQVDVLEALEILLTYKALVEEDPFIQIAHDLEQRVEDLRESLPDSDWGSLSLYDFARSTGQVGYFAQIKCAHCLKKDAVHDWFFDGKRLPLCEECGKELKAVPFDRPEKGVWTIVSNGTVDGTTVMFERKPIDFEEVELKIDRKAGTVVLKVKAEGQQIEARIREEVTEDSRD